MQLSGRVIFVVACGLVAASIGCDDSGSSDATDSGATAGGATAGGATAGGATAGGATAGGATAGGATAGGATAGGATAGGATAGGGGCTTPGQCSCADGMMGIAPCTNGVLGDCTCGIDVSDGGLPPPSPCPDKFACRSAMGFVTGADGFCTAIAVGDGPESLFPPMCTAEADCAKAGLADGKCTTVMIPVIGSQKLCLHPCTP